MAIRASRLLEWLGARNDDRRLRDESRLRRLYLMRIESAERSRADFIAEEASVSEAMGRTHAAIVGWLDLAEWHVEQGKLELAKRPVAHAMELLRSGLITSSTAGQFRWAATLAGQAGMADLASQAEDWHQALQPPPGTTADGRTARGVEVRLARGLAARGRAGEALEWLDNRIAELESVRRARSVGSGLERHAKTSDGSPDSVEGLEAFWEHHYTYAYELAALLDVRAEVLALMGRPQDAVASLEAALRYVPHKAVVRFELSGPDSFISPLWRAALEDRLGDSQVALGNRHEALRRYSRALTTVQASGRVDWLGALRSKIRALKQR